MIVLHLEHPTPNFERWQSAFDSDPIDRRSLGVNEYKIYRSVSNPDYVAVDLMFDNLQNAENTLKKLEILWGKVEGNIIVGPKVHIFELLESVKL